jgi:membrane-bound lytic murein transglycosylase B
MKIMNEISVQIAQTLFPVIVALVIALLGFAVTFLKAQTQKIQQDTLRRSLNAAIDEAHIVARDAVTATSQKLTNDLKAKAEDGKLTKEEAQQALAEAQSYFLTHISNDSMKILESALGPFKEWLDDFIEAKVGEAKNG